jgi:hypothetical protein
MLSNKFFCVFFCFYVFEGKHKVPLEVKSPQVIDPPWLNVALPCKK